MFLFNIFFNFCPFCLSTFTTIDNILFEIKMMKLVVASLCLVVAMAVAARGSSVTFSQINGTQANVVGVRKAGMWGAGGGA